MASGGWTNDETYEAAQWAHNTLWDDLQHTVRQSDSLDEAAKALEAVFTRELGEPSGETLAGGILLEWLRKVNFEEIIEGEDGLPWADDADVDNAGEEN